LFKVLEHVGEEHYYTTFMDMTGSSSTVNIGDTIVTTNYDMAIELYHRTKYLPLADGFIDTPNHYIREISIKKSYSSDERWLIKLHGSIWEFKQENRIIKTIADPSHSPIPINIDEEMIIYPTGEKPILKNPYSIFYDIFKHQEWRRMVARGYSFRDDPVNLAILENLEKVKDSILIVVDPQAESVIKNLGPLSQIYNERIIRIPQMFGDEQFV
jgi:hypothetical protein